MKQAVTSREQLRTAAQDILQAEGPGALSIRRLAKELGISAGVVYNYFPSKGELLLALTEQFWRGVFHPGLEEFVTGGDFLAFFREVYARLGARWPQFMALLAGPLALLAEQERGQGRAGERQSLAHMQAGFEAALAADKNIRPGAFSGAFSRQAFAAFALQSTLGELRAGKPDPAFLEEAFRRILY